MTSAQPNLKNIHTLLMEGFSDQDLRDLCFYDAKLNPVCDQFAAAMPKNTLVSIIITYCQNRMLFPTLLARAQKENPRRYAAHGPYFLTEPSTPSAPRQEDSEARVSPISSASPSAEDAPARLSDDEAPPSTSIHLQFLSEQIYRGNAVLFVGAGMSMGAGLPGWEALVQPLAERIGYTGGDPLAAATYYENEMGRNALITYLLDKLDTTGVQPTENHALLTRLPVNAVLTTNFDDLLERAYHQAGRSVRRVVGEGELVFWDASKVNLVKLHGSGDQPASIVITAPDYRTIYRHSGLIMQKLTSLLVEKTFLFVGYKAGDPDLNQIYDVLKIDLERHQRRPYLVTFDLDRFERKDLERRGFHVIEPGGAGGYTARMGRWLQALVAAVEGM